MTKKISALFATALFISSVVPALATNQESRTENRNFIKNFVADIKSIRLNTREEVKEVRTESRAEVREAKTTVIPEAKATLTQTRLEQNRKRITAVYQGISNSFTRHLEILKSYQTRVQAKLTAKKVTLPNNQNLIDAEAKLNNITTVLIPKFTTDQATLKIKIDSVSTSTDPKSLVPELKTLSKAIEQDLKDIRSQLVEALRLIVKAK